jgi:recombination protein RecA
MSTRSKAPGPLNDPTDGPEGFLPTGSLALDLALGGGWPRGRICEVLGQPGSGKTTLLLSAVAQAQRDGGMAALIDADHGVNRTAAARLGIDLERMPAVRTTSAEEAFEKIEELLKGGSVRLIAVDSLASLLHSSILADPAHNSGFHQNESHQYQLDFFFKAMLPLLARTQTVLLMSNQMRVKVGVIYGTPETVPFATLTVQDLASVRVHLSKLTQVKDGDVALGFECRAKVVKNRLAAPMQQPEFTVLYASGISAADDLLRLGSQSGALTKRGNLIYFEGKAVANGRQEFVRRTGDDPALAERIRAAVLEHVRA